MRFILHFGGIGQAGACRAGACRDVAQANRNSSPMASSDPSRAKANVRFGPEMGASPSASSGWSALVVAVAVAMASLPDYQQLTRRSDLGQMIRVRAADGTVLVSLGPSFGHWLRYDEIPPTMRSGDDRGRGQALPQPYRRRPDRHRPIVQGAVRDRALDAGRLDHHPAAGAQHLPDQQPHLRPQGQGRRAGAGAGAQILQGPDPRALSEPRLFRRRRLWHRRRQPRPSSAMAPSG